MHWHLMFHHLVLGLSIFAVFAFKTCHFSVCFVASYFVGFGSQESFQAPCRSLVCNACAARGYAARLQPSIQPNMSFSGNYVICTL